MITTTQIKLGMFDDGRDQFCGMLVGEGAQQALLVNDLLPAPHRTAEATIDALLRQWDAVDPLLDAVAKRFSVEPNSIPHSALRPLARLRVLPPLAPRQILQAGANYRAHVVDLMVAQKTLWPEGMSEPDFRRMAGKVLDARREHAAPYVFSGLPSAITGAYDDVLLPSSGEQPDWELELAVVIARPAYRVSRADAYRYVAGYTIGNDLTLRDRVYRPDLPGIGTDWLAAKNAPTFLPLGPYVVPSRCVPDPMQLRVQLRLNGESMQDESTADMLHDIPRLIEHVTSFVQLGPGDVLLTGSPAGNGAHYGRFLREGDVMEGEIEGLGMQRNRCVRANR